MTAPGGHAPVVVAGAGQAAFQLALSLREGGHDGPITLVGEEPAAPYGRPPLSKAYLNAAQDTGFRPPAFYAERGIALRLGTRATSIDRAARLLRVGEGEPIPYGHLVLATGARNRALPVAGATLPGVLGLRGLSDAEELRARLAAARRLVVVGAGFIGLEVAATAAARGLDVTVIEATGRPMSRTVSAPTAAAYRAAHEAAGMRFAFGATAARIHGTARAEAVETADGATYPADLVLVGIGVIPNAELAAEAGLHVRGGVLVDETLRTADPHISAIGDCAAYPLPTGPVALESVQAATDGARCVAARLLGQPAPYAALPWFWSEQGKLKLQIAGLGTGHDLAVPRGDPSSGAFSVFLYRGGALAAVESTGRPAEHMLARRLLAAGVQLPPERAADPGFDLKALLAAPARGAEGRAA